MNITKITERYILEHPSIKESLTKGIINYSSLARLIASELNLSSKNFDAILIACRRYARKLKEGTRDKKVLMLLKRSKINIKTKAIAVVLEKNIPLNNILELEREIKKNDETFHIIEGTTSITIVTREEFLPLIKKYFKHKIIKIHQGLAEVIIKSPIEVEHTPGFVGYIYSLLGEHNINIVETMSCWTETLVVILEEDIKKVIELLNF